MRKHHSIKFCLLVFLVPLLVSVSYGHTIVEDRCPSEVVYSFDPDNFVSGEIIQVETTNLDINAIHFDNEIGWPTHDLRVVAKDGSSGMIVSEFEGPAFEVIAINLDGAHNGEELVVTDKPSARGYRHSLLPAPGSNEKAESLSEAFIASTVKNIVRYWSLPESYFPMFTDIDEDGTCEIINFDDAFTHAFLLPQWYVNPTVYTFDSLAGSVERNVSLDNSFANTQWNDQRDHFHKILKNITISATADGFHFNMPEFDRGISATKFLLSAKKKGQFDKAVGYLKTLNRRYQALPKSEEWNAPPVFLHIVSGQKFEDFKLMNEELSLFNEYELDRVRTLYEEIYQHPRRIAP